MVNEILPSGQVLHLKDIPAPSHSDGNKGKKEENNRGKGGEDEKKGSSHGNEGEKQGGNEGHEFHISDQDNELLCSYFGQDIVKKIVKLHRRAMSTPKLRPSDLDRITSPVFSDRELRTKVHQAIRRIFNSQLESTTGSDGSMTISAAANRFKRNVSDGRRGRGEGSNYWDDVDGPYLHFTIYKENKDTMEVISFLARQLKMNPKAFQFAGTKDRRGVTVQRACVLRVQANRLAKLNASLRNAVVGDFEYRPHGLELGDLQGNEFDITLRECRFPAFPEGAQQQTVDRAKEAVGQSLWNLRELGYFNYYGLQRFGTFSRRTDTIGRMMLQGDFQGACDGILHYGPHVLAAALGNSESEESSMPISGEDKARAEAIHLFQTTGRPNDALAKMPRKFSAEVSLVRHLARSKGDYLGALQSIPRNLRLMYVHAYQSLVWNFAAGERWRLYGNRVVEGDLVIINEHKGKEEEEAEPETVDADGEVVIAPQAGDVSCGADDVFTRARALSASEAASGKYTIFDIVLPLPGFDILYPPNEMTSFYKQFMANAPDGPLDPFDMRRKWRDISLSGSYRKLLSRMGPDYSYDVKTYSLDDEQFVRTDLETIRSNDISRSTNDPPSSDQKMAVILKFQLSSSQYATMALRELMKGKAEVYVPDYGGR